MKEKKARARIDEQLSAYLDGELSPAERASLEARLEADADLRARLEALRQTVALVQGLPRVKAPRNFLLTPAMVGQTQPHRPSHRWLAPALTFATAISGLLCVVVLVGSLLGVGVGLPATTAPPGLAVERPVEPTPEEEPAYALAVPQVELTAVEETGAAAEELPEGRLVEPTGQPMLPALEAEAPLTTTAQPAEVPLPPAIALPTATATPAVKLPADQGLEVGETPTPLPLSGAEEGTVTAPPAAQEGRPVPWALAGGLSLLTLGLAVASGLAWRARRG